MRTIETSGNIDEQGNLVIPMPKDIPQGEHRVVVVIDVPEQSVPQQQNEEKEEKIKLTSWPPPGFKPLNATLADPNNTLRREDLGFI